MLGATDVRELARRAVALLYERRYHLETAPIVGLERFGLAADGRVHYEPSAWRSLAQVFAALEFGPDDVFADLGAGMGRVVVVAARHPFRRVMGVELAEPLAEIARENLRRNAARQVAGAAEIVTADVTEYELPDDVTVVYFHNPFNGPVFAAALGAVLRSLDRRPRRLRIVYQYPTEHEQVMATDRVTRLRRLRNGGLLGGRGHDTLVYELGPAQA